MGNVCVSDKDFYDNDNIYYLILSVGNYDKFVINLLIGDIFIDIEFDMEIVDNYVILVIVNDIGNLFRILIVLVIIIVIDVNDNILEFV